MARVGGLDSLSGGIRSVWSLFAGQNGQQTTWALSTVRQASPWLSCLEPEFLRLRLGALFPFGSENTRKGGSDVIQVSYRKALCLGAWQWMYTQRHDLPMEQTFSLIWTETLGWVAPRSRREDRGRACRQVFFPSFILPMYTLLLRGNSEPIQLPWWLRG